MSAVRRWAGLALAAVSLIGLPSRVHGAGGVLTLATTTSTENTGLLAHLHPDFERKTGLRVKVVAKGTGASLQLGRDGNADVVLVHARGEEDRFVEEGYGVMRRDVMYNDFVVIGPRGDPATVKDAESPGEALKRIATGGHTFISRGDASGTHVKEQELWREAGAPLERERVTVFAGGEETVFESVRPRGAWYVSVGQGMGKTIMIATERRAYTLADRGMYYAFALADRATDHAFALADRATDHAFAPARPARTDLAILCEGHDSLRNPYGVIAVNPERHRHVDFEGAQRYIEWITSPAVQGMIGEYRVGGKVLFHPSASLEGRE